MCHCSNDGSCASLPVMTPSILFLLVGPVLWIWFRCEPLNSRIDEPQSLPVQACPVQIDSLPATVIGSLLKHIPQPSHLCSSARFPPALCAQPSALSSGGSWFCTRFSATACSADQVLVSILQVQQPVQIPFVGLELTEFTHGAKDPGACSRGLPGQRAEEGPGCSC